jgi:hypothetical protein
MIRAILALTAAVLLIGCSTGVVPAGPDTFMVSVTEGPGLTNGGAAKAKTYREASLWCAKRGLIMVPIASNTHPTQPFGRYAGSELTFRALKPGDPEIKRPTLPTQ